jgi:hypothetical protein
MKGDLRRVQIKRLEIFRFLVFPIVYPSLNSVSYDLLSPKDTRGLEPISYIGALLNTILHAIVYIFAQFAECTGTDCK